MPPHVLFDAGISEDIPTGVCIFQGVVGDIGVSVVIQRIHGFLEDGIRTHEQANQRVIHQAVQFDKIRVIDVFMTGLPTCGVVRG